MGSGKTLTFATAANHSAVKIAIPSTGIVHFEQGGSATLDGVFAVGATITVASGETITVSVPANQKSNIVAGTGVTVISPPFRIFGLPTTPGSDAVLRVERISNGSVIAPTVINGEAFVSLESGEDYLIRGVAKGYAPSRFFTINSSTTSSFQFDLLRYVDEQGDPVYEQGDPLQSARITFDPARNASRSICRCQQLSANGC
jgi:hypothetical protein